MDRWWLLLVAAFFLAAGALVSLCDRLQGGAK